MQVALYQPEIPPNTGNIIRLCANTNSQLHLIHPLGFKLDDKRMRRAGLDYHEFTQLKEHQSYDDFAEQVAGKRIYACSTKGKTHYCDVNFQKEDVLLFGPETRGLPAEILNALPKEQIIKIPMPAHSRSLNLSNSVAVILLEAWRQLDFSY
jgi:tRNA (cytidine/uridine-2'-O-)-methyltransferase